MLFKNIDEGAEERIRALLAETQYDGSEFSLLYRKGWSFYNYPLMQVADEGDAIYIRFIPQGGFEGCKGYIYLPPLCKLSNVRAAFNALKEHIGSEACCACVMALPQEYIDNIDLDGAVNEGSNPDYEEYLYSPEDLITLSGKKYHGKRNHVTRFVNTYGGRYVFRSYEERDRQGLIDLYAKWSRGKEDGGTLMDEFRLLSLGLEMVERGEAYADVMEIDGKIVGFSLGETLPSGVAVVHVEKGEIEYDGIYPAINQMFSKKHFQGLRYVNRQEDMGLEGLRKSKLSYRPVKMSKKYVVRIGPCGGGRYGTV